MPTPASQTLVTCLYDLEKRECSGRRPVDFFFRHGKLVLDLEQPLVVYVDPDLAPRVLKAREDRGLAAITRIIPEPLESLPFSSLRETIADFATFENHGPTKDTPLHQIIEWSKFDLLERAMHENPFATDHFAWIDFGIGHVAKAPVSFPHASDRVALLQIRAVAPEEVRNRAEFLRFERGCIAGGFFRGSRGALEWLTAAFRRELAQSLERKFRPNEQMLLACLSAEMPERFDFYFGDYPSILRNWDQLRGDVETVFLNLAHCRTQGLWQQAARIAAKLRESQQRGALRLSREQEARLLDESYVAAWSLGQADLAAESRRQFTARCKNTAWFAGNRERIESNFNLLDRVERPLTELGRINELNPPDDAAAPLVSVIIPVYNGAATLERAITSVLAQTRRDFEVIVVDDASSDDSLTLARELAARNRQIRVVSRRFNSGSPATPRDDGVASSQGRFIALLDQDDYWLPGKLAAQLPLFDKPGTAVVFSNAYLQRGSEPGDRRPGEPLRSGPLPEGDLSAALLVESVVPCLTAVIRRNWLSRAGRFDRHRLLGIDDYYMWLRISLRGGRFAAVQEPLAVHCPHPDSLGASRQAEISAEHERMRAALAREFPGRLPP